MQYPSENFRIFNITKWHVPFGVDGGENIESFLYKNVLIVFHFNFEKCLNCS